MAIIFGPLDSFEILLMLASIYVIIKGGISKHTGPCLVFILLMFSLQVLNWFEAHVDTSNTFIQCLFVGEFLIICWTNMYADGVYTIVSLAFLQITGSQMKKDIVAHYSLCGVILFGMVVFALINADPLAFWDTLWCAVPSLVAVRGGFLAYASYVVQTSRKDLQADVQLVAMASFQAMSFDCLMVAHFLLAFSLLGTRHDRIQWFRLNGCLATLIVVLLRNKKYLCVVTKQNVMVEGDVGRIGRSTIHHHVPGTTDHQMSKIHVDKEKAVRDGDTDETIGHSITPGHEH